MARNQRTVPRSERVGHLLDCAEELMLARGYGATTMAAIAREAGVATNALLWYFPSKDHVLVGVLERQLDRSLAAAGRTPGPEGFGNIAVMIDYWLPFRSIYAMMLSRAPRTEIVDGLHQRFVAALSHLIEKSLTVENRPEREGLPILLTLLFEGALLNGCQGRAYVEMVKRTLPPLSVCA